MNIEIDGKFENLPGIKITLGVSLSNDTPQTNRLMQSILANQQASDSGNEIYYYLENDAIEMRYYKNQLITELIEYALENDKVIRSFGAHSRSKRQDPLPRRVFGDRDENATLSSDNKKSDRPSL